MPRYLADTMAAIDHFSHRPMGRQAAQLFREADGGRHIVFLSAVTLMEVLYLSEKRRIKLTPTDIAARLRASANYSVLPVTEEVVLTVVSIDDIPELHDRMIAATAKHHGLPVITNDQVMASSKHITTLW